MGNWKPLFGNLLLGGMLIGPLALIVMFGGFMVDDWGQLCHDSSIFEHIYSWKELWAYRPISWIAMPTIIHLLHDNYALLAIFHMTLLTFGFIEIVKWRYLNLSILQQRLALVLVSAPAVSSTLVFSVINQLSASLSLALFAVGIRIDRRTMRHSQRQLLVGIAFFGSLLCYEISLPLILAHFIFSLIYQKKTFQSVIVIIFVLIAPILWQKLIAPRVFNSNFSRLNSPDLYSAKTFFYSLLVSLPINLASIIFTALPLVVLVLFIYIWALKFSSFGVMRKNSIELRYKSVVLLIGVIVTSVLFLLSGQPSNINGYSNRGMSSAWILLSLFIASKVTRKKVFLSVTCLVFASANFIFFTQKIVEVAQDSRTRNSVVSQIKKEFEVIDIDHTAKLILDIPCSLKNSRFETVVFCTAWDAQGALMASDLNFSSVNIVRDNGAFSDFVESFVYDSKLYVVSFSEDFRVTSFQDVAPNNQAVIVDRLHRCKNKGQC